MRQETERSPRVDVALVPALLVPALLAPATARRYVVFLVVDVIRATTTLCVLFERGCRRVLIAPDIATAREASARATSRGYLLAGEVGGVAPPGFDFGNSPRECATQELRGREILFATTNGTRALGACAGGAMIFAGAFRNARAVTIAARAAHARIAATLASASGDASEAMARDEHGAEIVIVCAGRDGRPAFDDTLCAGYLTRELLRQAEAAGAPCALGEGARIALAVAEEGLARAPLRDLLAHSDAARAIARVGLAGDLDWCAALDATDIVPTIVPSEADAPLLVVEAR
ncbi:MAG: 2-phosphosulfolactate phosphatase [Ktedonobacterales bacterium]|nr:2-phosphosulfolactate phosphatase [Ktedonobacterales bacterium]